MHLMYYLNEKGERVYTLKKSHGEEEQPTLSRTPRASRRTTSSARSASPARSALGYCLRKKNAMPYERLDGPGRPGSKYPATTSSTAAAAVPTAAIKLREK